MNSTFLTVAVVGGLAVVSPGPDFLIVTRNSLLYSKHVGLATALGIACGNICWIAASVFGLSLIIARTVFLFNAIKLLGAAYLIYLGLRALWSTRNKSAPAIHPAHPFPARKALSLPAAYRMGFLTNLLNPKCALFFMSFFSIVITSSTPVFVQCAYGLEVMLIAISWFSLLATVLSVKSVRGVFQRVTTWLNRLTGAILIALGLKVAFSRHS